MKNPSTLQNPYLCELHPGIPESEKKNYIEDKQEDTGNTTWLFPFGKTYRSSSVCFGIRNLNVSLKVDHFNHLLIVALPFNKEPYPHHYVILGSPSN